MQETAHICTKDRPWRYEARTPARHPDAVQLGYLPSATGAPRCVVARCPHCLTSFRDALPAMPEYRARR